jgi:hypothetical protein
MIDEEEKLLVYKEIKEDNNVFEFSIKLTQDDLTIMLAGRRVWPTVWLFGYVLPMPRYYFYFLDLSIDDYGQRQVKVGVIHWQKNVYARTNFEFDIYPEYSPYAEGKRKYKLPAVRVANKHLCNYSTDINRDEVPVEISNLEHEVLQTVVAECFTTEHRIIDSCLHRHDTLISYRLARILKYCAYLRRQTREYMLQKCGCNCIVSDNLCRCHNLYLEIKERFPDARRLCSDEVFFKTARQ